MWIAKKVDELASIYPDFCKSKGEDCGKKATNKLCKDNDLGEALAWKKWDWKPRNQIHASVFLTQYANGNTCGENQNSFTPTKCRTFKYIDCAKGAAKKNAKVKGKKKLKSNNQRNEKKRLKILLRKLDHYTFAEDKCPPGYDFAINNYSANSITFAGSGGGNGINRVACKVGCLVHGG